MRDPEPAGRTLRIRLALVGLLLLGPFAALTAVVVATAPGVYGPDSRLAHALHDPVLASPALGTALRVTGWVTEPTLLRVIALVAAVYLYRNGLRRAAGWLVVTMTVGGVLGILLKQVFRRSRPEWPEAVTIVSGYSFPSGHALNSMLAAICALVLLWPVLGRAGRRLLAAGATGFVLLVGFDRVALGVHYLTDVLAGWFLAGAVAAGAAALFAVPPAVSPSRAPARGDNPTPVGESGR